MQTRLSSFCRRVMEAGVLTALVVAPLYYTIIALHPFDPGKSTMLQVVAVIILVAWVVKTVEERAPAAADILRLRTINIPLEFLDQPVLVAGLLMAGIYILSTLTSVDHRISLWGGFFRRQGLYTLLAYSVLFFAGAATLRTRASRERAVSVALLASLLVAFYSLVQHFGLDFLPWGEEVEQRAASTIGSPIFLGAFLILVIPLTLTRLGSTVDRLRRGGRRGLSGLLGVLVYGLLVIAQSGTIVFTQSKLSLAGLVAGMFLLGFLWAAVRGQRMWFLLFLLAAVVVATGILYISLPGTSLGVLQELPMLSRLTGALASRSFVTRSLIWQSVVQMITAHPGRLLVGYGPATLGVALQPFYTPALLQYGSATTVLDRSHSDLLDAAAMTGLLGLGAYLLLFWALFYQVLRSLGLVATSGQMRVFSGLWFGVGVAAALAVRLVEGSWRFAGLGLGLGAASGLFLYVTYHALWAGGAHRVAAGSLHQEKYLLMGLGGGILAHFVGGQFGIASPADRTYFWIFAALIAALAMWGAQEEGPQATSTMRAGPPGQTGARQGTAGTGPGRRPAIIGGLVMGLIVTTLLNDVIWRKDRLEPSAVMLGLLGAVWVAGAVIFLGAPSVARLESTRRGWSTALAGYVSASLLLPVLFLPLHIAFIGPNRVPQEQPVVYIAGLLGTIIALALALKQPGKQVKAAWRPGWVGLHVLVVLIAAAIIIVANVTPLRAAAYDKLGWSATRAPGRLSRAMTMYRRAIELTPQWEQHYLRLGALLQQQAESLPPGPEQTAYYEDAIQTMEAALRLRPRNAVHWINLGRLYVRWGSVTTEPVTRKERLQRALEYYEGAAALRPASADIHREWGEVYAVLGKRDKALEKFTYAVTLDPDYAAGYRSLAQLYEIEQDWAGAVRVYRELARLEPESVSVRLALARAYWRAGDLQAALAVYLQVLDLDPREYAAHRELIDLYLALGRPTTALAEARIARELAPSQEWPALDDVIARLASSGQ